MRAFVFTPTCRKGGLDVSSYWLSQQFHGDFVWCIGDNSGRDPSAYDRCRELVREIVTFEPKDPGTHRNLCVAYNQAIEIALEHGSFDVFVTLQDYIAIPPNGLDRFAKFHAGMPNALCSGITSIAGVPDPSAVTDIEGDFTIFKEPYREWPEELEWEDVRIELYSSDDVPEDAVVGCPASHWEANWAMMPFAFLEQGLRWDEDYDNGAAYENQDVAIRAYREHGATVWLDKGNRAVSLPHRNYFPGYFEELEEHSNRERHERKHAEVYA